MQVDVTQEDIDKALAKRQRALDKDYYVAKECMVGQALQRLGVDKTYLWCTPYSFTLGAQTLGCPISNDQSKVLRNIDLFDRSYYTPSLEADLQPFSFEMEISLIL